MEPRITQAVDIDAEPGRVWEVLADVERWAEWTPSIRWVRLLAGADRLVTGGRARVKQPGLPAMVWEVTSLDEGRQFTWEAATPGLRTVGEHRIDPQGAGSRVTLGITQTGPLARLAALLYGRRTRRYVQAEADGLRARVMAEVDAARA
jgi:uncharacterized protein YndB with AHSA1/START domain